ncbi:MAG: TonB-dependent receptor [Bacteroidota bacterium]|nr:TonB-dependent receptor [Bacteroidota bacterium]
MKQTKPVKGVFNQFLKVGLLLSLLFVCSGKIIYAEGRPEEILNKKISLVAEQKEVRTILSEISKLAEIKFVYSAQRIPARKKVSVLANDQRLGDVLNGLLQPLDVLYYVSGNQIVLMRRGQESDPLPNLKDHADNKRLADKEYLFKDITGKITNEKGEPLTGVSVLVRGTTKGTTTNANGNFAINAEVGEWIDFSMVGYKLYSVKIGQENSITVQLQPEISSIDEVVVVGYGSQKRSTLTGAVSSITSKTLNELPVAGIDQALQGRIAGLSVTNNGSPGTPPIVRIRGISSINFAADPLFVIDGFPTGDLASFDAKDVESVEVLKDASAAAIYGSRATSGVIMITTKKGKRDSRLSVNLDSYVGIQSPSKKIDLLNTSQYLQYAQALLGAAGFAGIGRLQPANFNKPVYTGASTTFAQTNTDWQDEYFVRNALLTQHNLSVSGGNAMSRFYTSAGYFKQDGIAQGLNYQRGNFRINSENNISNVFTFGENLYVAFGNQGFEGTGGNRSPLTNVVRMQPYLPVRNPLNPGGFQGPNTAFDGSDPTNPVEGALIGYNTIKTLKILGTAYLDVNFTSWLKFRSTFGTDYSNAYQQQYTPIYNDGGEYVASGTSSATSASIRNQRQLYTTLLYTQQLTFDKSFGVHHITATAVYEQQGQKFINETASGNQDNNRVQTLNGATNIAANSRLEQNLIKSYIGRVTYDYEGKYLLSASLRRDGLSVFAPGHKFKNFPAASVGWRVDQEGFLQKYKAVSELKLRAGYGLTGINGVLLGNYPYQVPVQANQSDYPFNGAITGPNGSFYNNLANPNLEWETTKQLNIGIDLGLWKNKFTLTAEYFRRQTDNLIINVPIPPSFGFGSGVGVPTNSASMRNNGFELQLGYHKRTGELKWDATGLLSIIRNKVLKLYTANSSFVAGADADFGNGDITNTVVGQPIQSFYGYIVDGIFQSATEVANSPLQVAGATAPGDLKFRDISGPNGKPDGKIDAFDRTFIGSYLPKFTYSFTYSVSYKNFDASIFLQGVQGNKIFNAERVIVEGMIRLFNSGTQVLDAWTPTHTNTNIPRAVSGDPNGNSRVSTRWIEDGSYLRIKNLMIGYNLPASGMSHLTKGAVKHLRLYISSQNLLTLTKYKGWDPEVGTRRTTLTNGIDYGQYPSARSFQFGIQAGF